MRHLNPETLARLVDEPASPEERKHLRSCAECADELRALREQTEALASLPEIRPPRGDWADLEARLRREGLIRDQPVLRTSWIVLPSSRRWLQAAAALVLFLGGTGVGAMASQIGSAGSGSSPSADGEDPVQAVESVEGAAEVLRESEDRYVAALLRYRRLTEESGEEADEADDPASRFAALETLMAASQAAIRQAPADPFLNGVLAGTMAERQAVLQRISSSSEDNWF